MAVGGEHFGLGPAPDLVVLEDIPQNSFAAKPISMVHGVVRAVLIEAGASIRPRNGRDAEGIRDRHPSTQRPGFPAQPHGDGEI